MFSHFALDKTTKQLEIYHKHHNVKLHYTRTEYTFF